MRRRNKWPRTFKPWSKVSLMFTSLWTASCGPAGQYVLVYLLLSGSPQLFLICGLNTDTATSIQMLQSKSAMTNWPVTYLLLSDASSDSAFMCPWQPHVCWTLSNELRWEVKVRARKSVKSGVRFHKLWKYI